MSTMTQALLDRYRCPEAFLNLQLRGRLSDDAGFFRFGPGTTCYGQSSSGSRAPRVDANLYDVFKHVTMANSKLSLPFNPTDIIANLRLERYVDCSEGWMHSLARDTYYLFRPVMHASLRKRLQKLRSRGWKDIPFPNWPVDRTVEDICEKVLLLALEAQGIDRIPFIWFWPNGVPGCVMMTHDVETKAGRDFCSRLMDIDESFGLKAAFQIVPEKRYQVLPQFLASIRDRGFELNLQDLNHDGLLFAKRNEFLRRAESINRYARDYDAAGFRAAVLYRNSDWYDAFEFSFDMSIPNVAHLDPQRGGCCTVMPYFIRNILELPVTTTQDYTLFYLLDERSSDLWRAQTELILQKSGLISFIVHPDYVIHQNVRRIYEDLLNYLCQLRSDRGVWFALPGEIDSWWRARNEMRIVRDGSSRWRIEGERAEDAVLAYARKAGDNLVYEVEETAGSTLA